MSVSYEDVLLDIGINPALKGFRALEKLCELREQNPNAKFSTNLLPRVGIMLGCDGSSVERAVRHAVSRVLAEAGEVHVTKILRQPPIGGGGGYELSRFVELCIIAKRRFNYDGGEILAPPLRAQPST